MSINLGAKHKTEVQKVSSLTPRVSTSEVIIIKCTKRPKKDQTAWLIQHTKTDAEVF